jgi:alanyl-tRNA synthetase
VRRKRAAQAHATVLARARARAADADSRAYSDGRPSRALSLASPPPFPSRRTGPLAPLKRAANSQKCIRAGGKHNDLDDVVRAPRVSAYRRRRRRRCRPPPFLRRRRCRLSLTTCPRPRPLPPFAQGKDTYHHTFFEMLGNWSFGDYFKEEAITWAWQLLTEVYGLPKDRFYVTYFAGGEGLPPDDEARDIWRRFLPAERILPFDRKANFWEMGDTGPCGPCSEIHFDRVGGRDAAPMVNYDDPTVIEVWNIVFMQFNREPSGALRELPAKHIDTGMGFERLTSILQGKMSNYDTDVFMPLFGAIHDLTGAPRYSALLGKEDVDGRDMAYRVVADHARTLTFAITDGAVPSNEGRGYVLRRILRRAVRYGQQFLGAKPGFFAQLVPVVVANFRVAFPELEAKMAFVQDIVRDEEDSFGRTLSKGIKAFTRIAEELKARGESVVPGASAFFLYDSMGFPVDLTQIMAGEAALTVDVEGFYRAMAEQKTRSQTAQKFARNAGGVTLVLEAEQTAWLKNSGVPNTNDAAKYAWHARPAATVRAIFTKDGFLTGESAAASAAHGRVGIVLDETPFYAESGGQVADCGALRALSAEAEAAAAAAATVAPGAAAAAASGDAVFDIADVQVFGAFVMHLGVVSEGATLRVGDRVQCDVDYEHRARIAPNHTMTHVLNFALREVLGEGFDQKGSIVMADKLRFDYAANSQPTPEQLGRVEAIVREQIGRALPVFTKVVPLAEALAMNGLRAVFGETYPDPVRVVSVGADVDAILGEPAGAAWRGFSLELCGGTHVANTSRAQAFAIVEETSIAKGVRRIVGVTRDEATQAASAAAQLEGEFAAARAMRGSQLEARVNELKEALNAAVLSAHVKSRLRDEAAELSKRIVAEQKAEAARLVEACNEVALAALAAARSAGKAAVVCDLPLLAGDGKVAQGVMKAVSGVDAGACSFLGTSADAAEDKVLVFAVASKAAIAAGATAKDWVSAALAAAGGKGGGRDDGAQGTAKGAAKLAEIVAAATAYGAAKGLL